MMRTIVTLVAVVGAAAFLAFFAAVAYLGWEAVVELIGVNYAKFVLTVIGL